MINETCLTVFNRIKTFKELYFVKRNNCPIFPSALSEFPDNRPNFHVRPYVTLNANQTYSNALTNEISALLSQSAKKRPKFDVFTLSSVIPANDTRESLFRHRNFPRREWGSNLGPLAPEASA